MAEPQHRNTDRNTDRTAAHDLDAQGDGNDTAGRFDGPWAPRVRKRLARFMFDLQADDYEADDGMRELAWTDHRIRDFWLGQADAVVGFLELET